MRTCATPMTACRNNIEVQPHALASARAVPGCLRKFTWGQTVGNRNAQISIRVIDAGDIHAHERSSLLSCSIDLEAGARRLVHRCLLRYRDDSERGIQRWSVVVIINAKRAMCGPNRRRLFAELRCMQSSGV